MSIREIFNALATDYVELAVMITQMLASLVGAIVLFISLPLVYIIKACLGGFK